MTTNQSNSDDTSSETPSQDTQTQESQVKDIQATESQGQDTQVKDNPAENPQSKDSSESTQEAVHSGFSSDANLSILQRWLNPPANLRSMLAVTLEFQTIIDLAIDIGEPDYESKKSAAIAATKDLIEHKADYIQKYPELDNQSKKIQGLCRSNGIYSVLLKVPLDHPDILSQWRAAVATFLPYLFLLQGWTREVNQDYLNDLYLLTQSLRELAKFGPGNATVLRRLPTAAMHPDDWTEKVELICDELSVDLAAVGPLRAFHLLVSIADRCQDLRPWDKVKRKRPKRSDAGARQGRQNYVSRTARGRDEHGVDLSHVRKYYPAPSKLTADLESFDRNLLKHDQVPAAMTVSLELDRERVTDHFLRTRENQARQTATYVAQAIERSNQRLPINASTLGAWELEVVLRALENLDSSAWDDIDPSQRSETAAWGAFSMFLSRPASQLFKVAHRADQDKATCIQIETIEGCLWLHLPVAAPAHAAPSARQLTVAVQDTMRLEMPPWLFERLPEQSQAGDPVFKSRCERQFGRLLFNLNRQHHLSLTPHKIECVMENLVSQYAGDHVVALYFTGRAVSEHIPAIYSSVPVRTVQEVFNQACLRIQDMTGIGMGVPSQMELPLSSISDCDQHVGSKHVPLEDTVHAEVVAAQTKVRGTTGDAHVSFAHKHNTYTAYSILLYLLGTAMRPLGTFLPAISDVDLSSGCVFQSDKDHASYEFGRVASLPQALVAQLLHHKAHWYGVRAHLAISNPQALCQIDALLQLPDFTPIAKPDRPSDLDRLDMHPSFFSFINKKTGELVPPSAAQLSDYLSDKWQLRIYALRHFLRSQLMGASVHSELINALLGHMDRGQGPWLPYSTLPPRAWAKRIDAVIVALWNRLGIKALASPLRLTDQGDQKDAKGQDAKAKDVKAKDVKGRDKKEGGTK